MDNLWKKESRQPAAHYVDIFANIPDEHVQAAAILIEQSKLGFFCKNDQHSTDSRLKGNNEFRSKDWAAAMNHYNESLAYAIIGSENVALAYSNRSACFFNMKLYDKALVDVELALNSNPPGHVKEKLLKRKQDSLGLMKMVESTTVQNHRLDYKPNPKFPCLADVMDLKYSSEFGRHMVANQNIPIGKIVLKEAEYIGDAEFESETKCRTCFRKCVNFIACDRCPDAMFCDEDCMRRNGTHKWECQTFFNAMIPAHTKIKIKATFMALEAFNTVESLMELVERALISNTGRMPDTLNDMKSKYHFFLKLNPLTKNPEEVLKISFFGYKILLRLPKVAAIFNTEAKKRFLMHLVQHHTMITANNGHKGDGFTLNEDYSLCLNLAMFNHSCIPNLFHFTEGREHFCVTIRPVRKGDQLCISYLGNAISDFSKADRQKNLQTAWDFICKCDLCEFHDKSLDVRLLFDPDFRFIAQHEGSRTVSAIQREVMDKTKQFLTKNGHHSCSKIIQATSNSYGCMFSS